MAVTFNPTDTAVVKGIKLAGIGKRGSQPLPRDVIDGIIYELKTGQISPITQGALFGSLMMKGLTADEFELENALVPGVLQNPADLVSYVAGDAPDEIQAICTTLLEGKELDKDTAHKLGTFMLSDLPGDGARGLAASVLRVRYETPDEYEALLQTFEESIEAPFKSTVPEGDPIIQIAEPFDGVDQSYMITPLLGKFLQSLNYRAVHMVGRNSGPKLCFNLLDILKELKLPCLQGKEGLADSKPEFGYVINQQDLSKALDRWVNLRREMVKRPYFSTLEKFLNPAKARILVTSAYHPPYSEKMATIAERAGFPGSIVIRNGQEGTLAFPVKRPVKILCSARQADGSYKREEITFDPEDNLKNIFEFEKKIESPTAADNADLIRKYNEEGKSGSVHFDERVRLTCIGLKQAIARVEESIA